MGDLLFCQSKIHLLFVVVVVLVVVHAVVIGHYLLVFVDLCEAE